MASGFRYAALMHSRHSPRGQMIVCSATLHSPEVKQLAEEIMHFPTWVDLKVWLSRYAMQSYGQQGQDAVPETVHHVVRMIDPLEVCDLVSYLGLTSSRTIHGARQPASPRTASTSTIM
jgi:superfamily II DNA/RNA helicase